jgi:aminoglycoside phosphotransferase (APT) family kinase protein
VVNLQLFANLLKQCKVFWQAHTLDLNEQQQFRDTCKRFYRVKTLERVEQFYKNFARQDGNEAINGMPMPNLEELFDSIDWNWLADGLPGRFHGDFHFENILWSSSDQKFTFLDWRQDFGGSLNTGDIYYDLAKLLHGLIINHELIARDYFCVNWAQDNINYDFHRKQRLVECEQYFGQWLESEGFDRKKVQVLTALIFLNIAALHHYPYSLLLFALGKSMLFEVVCNK